MRLLALVKSFPVIQIKEIRPVVMAVLKNMSYIEDRQDFTFFQCCGSGIRCLCSLDPGYGMGKKSGSGSGMNNPDHIS
jgi:hypothetical protein